jgi:transcriptional regulator with XRE-family HTH domain
MTLEDFIKEQRQRKKITQNEIAMALGVHAQYISNIERGQAKIPVKYFKKLSRILKINVNRIINVRTNDLKKDMIESVKI